MKKSYFITGTDTGVGKTWSSVALMHYFKQQGESVIGMKPVAAGCDEVEGELVNEDALLLQQHASVSLPYSMVNPYAFEQPVSPHLAAMNDKVELARLKQGVEQLKPLADVLIVEGAGGWLVPLSEQLDIADLAVALQLPVIVVVAIRLGCINHARLTLQSIQMANVPCAGWIAVCVEENMLMQQENILILQQKLSVPLLGILPYNEQPNFADMAGFISIV